jgi:tetraacyldisaccharide 4'-kinase
MCNWLQRQWNGLSLWHILLVPLSWLFWLLSGLRRAGYKVRLLKSYQLPVPVIIVGNISVGGTGKTPLVIWLAKKLKQQGLNPAIVSRGYGGSINDVMDVHADSDPVIAGDEPVLMAKRGQCPVWVGRDRVTAAQVLLRAHPECDVLISDDGLQHYRLRRDFEIAVVDSSRGFGTGWLLPAGSLRECKSRLKTVDAVVYNGNNSPLNALSMRLEGAVFHNLRDPVKTAVAADFSGKNICAIAGIGNPARFFQQLTELGLQFESQAFPDHHVFQPTDLQITDVDVVLMTEKDAVKCKDFAEANYWYLPVNAVVDEALIQRIMDKINQN